MKRNPSGPPLEGVDKENGSPSVHVLHSQAKRFAKTNAGAVQDQNQGPVECGSEERSLEISAERQEVEDVLFGKEVRNERRLGRQVRPDRFSYAPRLRRSVQVTVELPENCGIAGDADWLAAWFAGQPGQRRSIKLPVVILASVVDEKSIKLPE